MQWIRRLDSARESKAGFQKVADQCTKFFTGDTRFMWDDKFRDEFMPGMEAPGIQVTLAKAFELVAIFGPTLFWDSPTRQVKSHRGVDTEAVAELLEHTQLADLLEDLIQADEKKNLVAKVRNSLMQIYLNWSQSQQPSNGLAREAQLCITEALVKGRACAWTQDYQFPGSDDVYTGTFFDSVDNLLIDPDCTDPELRTATWIARRHLTPVWEVERVFDLEKESLQEYASKGSTEKHSREDSSHQNTNDLIEWWEVWSKGGVGSLMRDSDRELGEAIDKTVGDFAYCCVAREVPYFLNAPPKKVYRAKPSELKSMFAWRTANYGAVWECWRDGQWPVSILDFYPVPNSAWPLAPMAPGLGELIAMNVLLTSYVEVSWENRKQLIAVMKNAASDIKAAIQSAGAISYVEINPTSTQSIKDVVSFLDRPPANRDILDALAMLSESFDKRTGLSEILYAMSSRQIRVAADANTRQQNASIRPEKMGKDVAAWMSRVAANEMSMAAGVVRAESLTHLLGPVGALLWKEYVETADTSAMMREMTCMVEASDMMRPNREKDLANLQSLAQYMLQPYQTYAQLTGDSTPLNGFLQSVGEAMDHDVTGWEMGSWKPEPDPQAQQMQMQAQQVELQNTQADTMLKQAQTAAQMATAKGKEMEPLMKRMEFEFETQKAQAEMQMRQAEVALAMQAKEDEHQLAMVQKAIDHQQSTQHSAANHMLKLVNTGTDHEQKLSHTEENHDQSLKHQKEADALKVKQMKSEAALMKKETKGDNSDTK